MTLTLSQLVKRHIAPEHAGLLASVFKDTPPPVGRIALHSMRTKEHVPVFIPAQKIDQPYAPIVHISRDIPLDELVIAWRDLEEEQLILPRCDTTVITQPRIKAGNYAVFGIEEKESIALFIINKKREKDIAKIPGLRQIKEFETYRMFADYRDDTDLVTGLRSRAYLDRLVSGYYKDGRQTNFDLIVADLDHFKSLNEKHGYMAGDLGLKIMGEELMSAIGSEGIASRRHYGDETLSVVFKDLFEKTPGGAEAWARNVNKRLAERSRDLRVDFELRLTFGVYHLDERTLPDEAKKRADQALVYAKNNQKQVQIWNPQIPTHEDMQSGRHLRFSDPELVQFGTAAKRSFPKGIRPDQAEGAQEILDDIIHKSQPIREAGNQEVLASLAHHLLIAQPSAMATFSPDRVWQAIYLARKNLGISTAEEKTLEDKPERVAPYLSERLNLKHLLETDPQKEEYNKTICSFINCRYDDTVRTITASTESQHQSRFIVSGRDTPTTGELSSIGQLLNLLTSTYHFEDRSGLISFYCEDEQDQKTTIYFDQERFDISPIAAQLRERNDRISNHFGLRNVTITPTEITDGTPHYDFTANSLESLVPLLWIADDQVRAEQPSLGRVRLFSLEKGVYGAHIPNAAQLLFERILLDQYYAARIFHEPPPTPCTDSSVTTRVTRPQIPLQRSIELINEHYRELGVASRGCLPVFHAPEEGMFQLLSDLYIARDIYLRRRHGAYSITDLRVPLTETETPQFEEIVTHYTRTFHDLLTSGSKLLYQIDSARPRLVHTPNFVGLRQLVIPISARYGELFCRQA